MFIGVSEIKFRNKIIVIGIEKNKCKGIGNELLDQEGHGIDRECKRNQQEKNDPEAMKQKLVF